MWARGGNPFGRTETWELAHLMSASYAPDGAITCARHVKTHRMPSHQVGRHTYAVFRCVYGVIGVISGAKLSRGAPDVGIIRTRWSSHLRSPCQEASYSMNEVGSQRHLVLVYGLIGVIYGGTLSGELEDYSDNFISADAF